MDKLKEMWDSRYSSDDYAYGIAPNEFFKDAICKYKLAGKILLPGEGEGRNAVYAAKKGLDVTAFDISIKGKNKALKLAKKENVKINYEVGDFFELNFFDETYDSAALIYAHFPPPLLLKYHKKIAELLKPNGLLILEGFSENNLKIQEGNKYISGPKKIEFLFSMELIIKDFSNFEIIQLEELELELNEGDFHKGMSSVIRFVGKKKK